MNQYFVTYTVDGQSDSLKTAFVDCEVGKTARGTQYNLKEAIADESGNSLFSIYIRSASKIN